MSNQDKKMITACTQDDVANLFSADCEHPMDEEVINKLIDLNKKIRETDDDYEIFRHRKSTDELWGLLLEKSIKCLRYHDGREPFSTSGGRKKPRAYGIEDLKSYYRKYSEFERILYGSGRYYRDHIIHVLRTWLSGVELLVKNGGAALEKISIYDKNVVTKLAPEEKVSVWTIIALTHDLGYPLEKAKGIISITQDMLSKFITNPDISVDFAFHGVQNYMNDYIVRLMSSKMEDKYGEDAEKPYVARLQSKYYFKFQKSLEKNSHGILSTLIIYKLLTYFLESDYNIHEDYAFDKEECRQFYIRREILRAIAAHTCDDIYQMYMGSFAFLLRICDDTQEWGRKSLSELYVNSEQEYELQDIDLCFGEDETPNNCIIREQIKLPDKDSAVGVICRFQEQALVYITIFRDGQDTSLRDFSFERHLKIVVDEVTIELSLKIDKDRASEIDGEVILTSDKKKNKIYGKELFDALTKELETPCICSLLNSRGAEGAKDHPENWRKGKFKIPLAS